MWPPRVVFMATMWLQVNANIYVMWYQPHSPHSSCERHPAQYHLEYIYCIKVYSRGVEPVNKD